MPLFPRKSYAKPDTWPYAISLKQEREMSTLRLSGLKAGAWTSAELSRSHTERRLSFDKLRMVSEVEPGAVERVKSIG